MVSALLTSRRSVRTRKGWLALPIAALALALSFPAVASAVLGDHFSFAPTSANGTDAPAFPDSTAWWAGVCDLDDGAAATSAQPPIDRRFPSCIEHPAGAIITSGPFSGYTTQVIQPLASGVAANPDPNVGSGADGWISDADGTSPVSGPSWRLADVTEAGAHPDGSAAFWFGRAPDRPSGTSLALRAASDGSPRNITVKLPRGVLGDPTAVPQCPAEKAAPVPAACPPKTQVGVSTITLNSITAVYPVYNVEPREGKTAELLISGAGISQIFSSNVPIVGSARTGGDFGIDATAIDAPTAVAFLSQTITLWGVPWAASHDLYRPVAAYCGTPGDGSSNDGTYAWNGGLSALSPLGLHGGFGKGCSQEPQSYDPSWGPIRPFFSTQTECAPQRPSTRIVADNWSTDVVAAADSEAPNLTDCDQLPFDPSFELAPTSSEADSATGLDVRLEVPQNDDPPAAVRFNADDDTGAPAHWKSPAGRATAHLKDSVVNLPAGVAVNPSAATGLAGCSDSQVGVRDASTNPLLFNDGDPFDGDTGDGAECPSASIIGTAEVKVPLLEELLTGYVVLGEPKSKDPVSGEMLRLFLVVRNAERGIVAKIFGRTFADPETGRLRAVFENNPQVPFDELKLRFKGGQRGTLAMPQTCGSPSWDSEFTPWSAAHSAGGTAKDVDGSFGVAGDCELGFAPALDAGMSSVRSRGSGTFSFRFARRDGQQWFRDLTADLPTGLLAKVSDVSLCTSEQASTGSCPAASRIGTVDAQAGSGSPFVLEQKGDAYLTEGYKGGAYGLLVKVRAVAGPFRGPWELDPIVVRQAIHVDPTTAQVRATSDPFPKIWHGIPLRVRSVTVNVDRPSFMLNPSNCASKQISARIGSTEGRDATIDNGFRASGCSSLPFKPKLALALTGRKQTTTGKHPGVRAVVTQAGIGEAGIEKAVVRLPKSLALDPDNAQALCEFEDGTRDDLEKRCPKGSIVGRARATTPLLDDPLVGNVYFVKNVRTDPKTGNRIRTLPMVIVALRGEIAVNLKGESSTTKDGRLVNTFANVPDAPVSKFNMNINGGKNGILAVTRTRRSTINLCAGRHVAEADTDGQNGRRHDFDVRMRTPCSKAQTRAAKRAAAKAKRKAAA